MLNTADSQRKTIPATLELSNGERLVGQIISRVTIHGLADHLNTPDPFLELELLDGESIYVSKATVASVKPLNIPKADELTRRVNSSMIDPYRTLGIEHGAGANEIRSAYLALAMKYHPDRYARLELPREIEQYLSSALGRINAAYQMLGGSKEKVA